jgi:hypothetical protein
LEADPDVTLSSEVLARCFDPEHALRHVGAIIDRVLEAP